MGEREKNGGGISLATLASLSGMEAEELRRLKHVLPPQERGLYPLAKTLAALFKHLRESKSQPVSVRAEELEEITGLTDRRHRQLAAEGFFPPPEKGCYQMLPALVGIIRFYRTSNEKESLQRKRGLLLDKQIEEKQIGIDESLKRLKPVEFFAQKVMSLGAELNGTLNFQLNDRLPALNAGLNAPDQRVNNRKVYLELCRRFREFADQWTS